MVAQSRSPYKTRLPGGGELRVRCCLHVFHRHDEAISVQPFQIAVKSSANTLLPEVGSRVRDNSAEKDTAMLAHQASRFDRFGRLPHHGKIGFLILLKALIQGVSA